MRRILVAFFHSLEAVHNPGKIPGSAQLSPRQRQTLERLLLGDSEKQIAIALHLSQHTVHMHMKEIYRRHAVNSRGELLARFVRRPLVATMLPAIPEIKKAARSARDGAGSSS